MTATEFFDGCGGQHIPQARQRIPTSSYCREEIDALIGEADDLTGRLRRLMQRRETLDRRLLTLCGRAEARYLRRNWLRNHPYTWEDS